MPVLERLTAEPPTTGRRRLIVRGIVQGVGFRPFVYRLAHELALDGWIRNDAGGVTIEVQGESAHVERLVRRLRDEAPPLARVDSIAVDSCEPEPVCDGFTILESFGGRVATAIPPDAAVCTDCLRELFTPGDRRHRYAFINCTHCGPRYTITRRLPYDRAQTSMAAFTQCPDCLTEYHSPLDRRFHAEPNACADCGPRLILLDAAGTPDGQADPVAGTLARLLRGEIVAIKGLGGFHLACDARNADAVARLRARKAREEKPFAVMTANADSAAPLAFVSNAERAMLEAVERPIVLLGKRARTNARLPGVAPGLAWLGVMLPYTPLHYLLFHEAAGRPKGVAWLSKVQELVLVMTSANPGGEPLVTGNDEALARLTGIADAFLIHDRDVVVGCDDSVLRKLDGADVAKPRFQFLRRARGYTPRAIRLAGAGPSVVALGGHFKNTCCVTRGDEAFVSQHVGDLDNAPTCVTLERTVAQLMAIVDVQPAGVAHDLHPDFYSSRLAGELAARLGLPLCPVQHHHAHVAAVLAEHRFEGPVLGLALDGVGLGSDGAAWGGELLIVDGANCTRVGRLRPLRLPGGDRAAREPWRMAAAALALLGRDNEIPARFPDEPAAQTVASMLASGLNAPPTSSMGRWFDAATGLLGLTRRMAFEGQAAMQLEGLAEKYGAVPANPGLFAVTGDNELDLSPLLAHLADETDPGRGAALFHATLVAALGEWVAATAQRHRLTSIAGGGGCFLNAILARGLRAEVAARGLVLLEAQAVPPNDGGLALGQAWVARHHLNGTS